MKYIVGSPGKLFPILLLFFFYSGCTKDNENPSASDTAIMGRLELHIQHLVDNNPLEMDTLKYTNGAAYTYSVTRLLYYLDSFVLTSGNRTVPVKGTFLVDAGRTSTSIILDSIPIEYYTGITFLIGLRPTLNIPKGLPTDAENLKMVWPEIIGGGYHFLMLEGHYQDRSNTTKGYTFHLGTNNQRVEHTIIPLMLKIQGGQTSSLNLGMQINEWFVHPYTYDFAISGNHIMGIDSSMQKIRDNGKDVFKVL